MATKAAESASSLIITRFNVLLIGTNVIATAMWIRPNWNLFRIKLNLNNLSFDILYQAGYRIQFLLLVHNQRWRGLVRTAYKRIKFLLF